MRQDYRRGFRLAPHRRLLHKTDPKVVECFGPITTVNGKVWPILEAEPTTYRFRVAGHRAGRA